MEKSLKKRSEIEERYKWNLEDLIPSKEALDAMLKEVSGAIPHYADYRGKLGRSAADLRAYLEFDEALDLKFSRLFSYALQKSDEDTADGASQELLSAVQTLSTEAMTAAAFVEPELLAIPKETMEGFLASGEVDRYERRLLRLEKKKEHTLSEPEERLLAGAADALQTASVVFNRFNNADLRFAAIRGGDGGEAEVTHGRYMKFMTSSDREVRREAFLSYSDGYRRFGNTLAAMFEGNIKQACFYARSRRYDSTRQYFLSENEIPERVYDSLLETVRAGLSLLHRYVGIRRRTLGLDELHMYDLYAPLAAEAGREYSYEEAQALLLKALSPLGAEYLDLLNMGFENRWIDVYESEGKRSGAYSNCAYGVHPYVLMSFDGSLDSVLTLAHEMGHSIHSWYSNSAQPYPTSDYRIFVAEVASTCNEVIVLRHLIGNAKNAAEKKYLISQLLERFRTTLFRQTMFADFELTAHRMVWSGTPLTKDGLCRIYHELNAEYFGDGITVDSGIDCEWARIPHFYRPFYVYQYATGFAAATAIAGHILAGDEAVLSGYFRFLKGGSSMTPVELLRLCGIDMEKPQAVQEALDEFGALLDEFERL